MFATALRAQTPAELPSRWSADWVTHPTAPRHDHAVVLFRKNLDLVRKPDRFLVHVSADNHYRLFVNGQPLGQGPARGDLSHWFYETYDLAPHLRAGQNVLAAEVVNFGPKRTFSMFSQMTSFWLQGHGEAEKDVNTKAGRWKTHHNQAVTGRVVNWIFNRDDIAFGLYVGNPTDSVDAATYPWGWERPDYDDTRWETAAWGDGAGPRGSQYAGGINFSNGKLLLPRRTPLQRETRESIGRVVRVGQGAEGTGPGAKSRLAEMQGFLDGQDVVIPANSRVKLWIDHRTLTMGYPELRLSGGRGSRVQVAYAETLFNPDGRSKGHRDTLTGKKFIGIKDVFVPDGGQNRSFRPRWLRCFRFLELDLTTGGQALTLHDYHHQLSAVPLEQKAVFETDDPRLNRLVAPGWRTASLCAQDFLMSDGYYELMQYTGDSRVHSLALMTLAGHDSLTRNALIQFDESRIPDGLTFACAPNAFYLVMPAYSLIWVDQVHDYLLWHDDRAFLSARLPGLRAVLGWFEDRVRPDGLLGPIDWWPALAWPQDYKNGEPPAVREGGNVLHSLHLAYSLRHAAEVFDFCGESSEAARYRALAARLNAAAKRLAYSSSRGLFGENPAKKQFSKVTNILATLSGAAEGAEGRALLSRTLADTSRFGTPDLFWHLYLFEALNKTGLGNRFFEEISEWQTMMDRGLTTYVEVPIEWGEAHQRSECHPWSTSPNVFFFKTIAGIHPTAPGHRAVEIAPELGPLKRLNARYPHRLGAIALDVRRSGERLSGTVTVPAGMRVTFRWKGKTRTLKTGMQRVDF